MKRYQVTADCCFSGRCDKCWRSGKKVRGVVLETDDPKAARLARDNWAGYGSRIEDRGPQS